jgi:hypothetical protein
MRIVTEKQRNGMIRVLTINKTNKNVLGKIEEYKNLYTLTIKDISSIDFDFERLKNFDLNSITLINCKPKTLWCLAKIKSIYELTFDKTHFWEWDFLFENPNFHLLYIKNDPLFKYDDYVKVMKLAHENRICFTFIYNDLYSYTYMDYERKFTFKNESINEYDFMCLLNKILI